MQLSKKQQSIYNIIRQQAPVLRADVFTALEGEIEEKSLYRSRYNSFQRFIKVMLNNGILEEKEKHLSIAPIQVYERVQRTQSFLSTLSQLRNEGKPLTLANLKAFDDFESWVMGAFQWKLETPKEGDTQRVVDVDQPLDQDPYVVEGVLRYINVEQSTLLSSGLLFTVYHREQLQRLVHDALKEQLLQFSLSPQQLKRSIKAKLHYQPPEDSIEQLMEAVGQLSPEEIDRISESFQSPYLQELMKTALPKTLERQSTQPQLQQRFPLLFSGEWEWDRLYYQLQQKIIQHAQSQGWYQNKSEWKLLLKNKARFRFQQAQRTNIDRSSTYYHYQASAPKSVKGMSLERAYHVLGVSEQTNIQEVRVAFRKLAKAHHPDQGGDPEFFRSLNQAYTRLMKQLGG